MGSSRRDDREFREFKEFSVISLTSLNSLISLSSLQRSDTITHSSLLTTNYLRGGGTGIPGR